MTKHDYEDRARQDRSLIAAGISAEDCNRLRRISHTLRRWFELECGIGDGQTTRSIERASEDENSQPYLRVQYPTTHGYHDSRSPIRDLERGARRRLAGIIADTNLRHRGIREQVAAFIQTDPRGAALYILRSGDVPEGQTVESCYDRGICVY